MHVHIVTELYSKLDHKNELNYLFTFKLCPIFGIIPVSWVRLQTFETQTDRPGAIKFRFYKYTLKYIATAQRSAITPTVNDHTCVNFCSSKYDFEYDLLLI